MNHFSLIKKLTNKTVHNSVIVSLIFKGAYTPYFLFFLTKRKLLTINQCSIRSDLIIISLIIQLIQSFLRAILFLDNVL